MPQKHYPIFLLLWSTYHEKDILGFFPAKKPTELPGMVQPKISSISVALYTLFHWSTKSWNYKERPNHCLVQFLVGDLTMQKQVANLFCSSYKHWQTNEDNAISGFLSVTVWFIVPGQNASQTKALTFSDTTVFKIALCGKYGLLVSSVQVLIYLYRLSYEVRKLWRLDIELILIGKKCGSL